MMAHNWELVEHLPSHRLFTNILLPLGPRDVLLVLKKTLDIAALSGSALDIEIISFLFPV